MRLVEHARRRDDEVDERDDAPRRSPFDLLALQRSAGNQAVGRLLRSRVLARARLSDGRDAGKLTLAELKEAWDDALMNDDEGDIEALRQAMEVAYRGKRLRDEDEEWLDEALFGERKLFKGVSYTSVKDEADFLAKNPESRPPMYSSTFDDVYAGAVKHKTGILKVQCDETPHSPVDYVYFQSGGGRKETDNQGNVLGAGKRPPVCHIAPYNHMMRAWLDLMQSPRYKGVKPGASGYDDAHRELAWGDPNNLQPGHNSCNSRTARQAVGGNYSKAIEQKVRQWAQGQNWI